MKKMVQTDDLIFEYAKRDEEGNVIGNYRAIDQVNLEVEEGQFIAVLGHNGSGKSTLAKHLNAILVPTEGTVWVDGTNTSDPNELWNVRQSAGMVFQNPDNQIIGTVVEEDVGFGPENLGVPTDEIWQRVEDSLKAVGMISYRHHSPNKLSGGQKQRVAIAGVIAMKPRCIVLNYVYSAGTAYEKQALKDICLEIPHGEFVGVIGHTGSGKSTLIQHLNGLIRATSGALYYNGENIYEDGYNMKALRNQVGLVFQYPEHQLFEVDVLSDVCFGPKNQGLSKEECEKRAREALKLVGLKEKYYDASPFELSGGQKRRVAIAGVLAMEPQVLILDEPTAGLDPKGRDEILDQIAYLHKKRNLTVILVSHSMDDIAKYADRIIVMNQGEVMYNDVPKKVFAHYKELEEVGLAAPQVTYIMHELKAHGLNVNTEATTIEEAADSIMEVMAHD